VDALGRMIDAVGPGGVILDLQVIRPDPSIELDGDVIAGIDGAALFESADAATAAIDVRIAVGELVEEAVDDHHVLEHFANGAELVAHFADSRRNIDEAAIPRLRLIGDPLVTREACRLRRLRIV
jgi:hypothetical protein